MSKVQLMLGDCLERMKEIPDGSISMILADPPYGTTACKWDSIIDLPLMWEQLKRIIKPNGAIVMTASQPFTSVLTCSNLKMFKYSMVWEKSQSTGFLNAWKMPLRAHEDLLVFYKKSPTYNPELKNKPAANIRPITSQTKESDCYGSYKLGKENRRCPADKSMPKSVVKFNNSQDRLHPTGKPVSLMEYLIKTYTNEGETVLDFTAGSFTTGVACVNINRKFIGIEMNEGYFDIGVGRIKERIKCLDLKIEPTISTGD